MLSQYRPRCPIIAVTRTARTARIVSSLTYTTHTHSFSLSPNQCHLYRGVHPLLYETEVQGNWFEDVDQRLIAGLDKGKREGYIFKAMSIQLSFGVYLLTGTEV